MGGFLEDLVTAIAMQRILWVAPIRTTLIAAAVGFVLSYPSIGVLWVINQVSATPGTLKLAVLIIMLVAMSLFAAVFAALAALTYNLMAHLGQCIIVRGETSPVLNLDAPPLT